MNQPLNHLFLHLESMLLLPLQNTQQLKNLVSNLNSIMIELINIWKVYNKTEMI